MLHNRLILVIITGLVFLTATSLVAQVNSEMSLVKGGGFVPFYGDTLEKVMVDDFYMDPYPVTNAEFLEFVKQNQKWSKSKVKGIFADERYLNNWEADNKLGLNNSPDSPVTNVSWFAAKEYCECQGKRLPTLEEWEFAAMADEETPDARVNKDYNQRILGWYETPKTFDNKVGSTFKNYWGIYDLHGLVWEWTSNFNSVMLSNESRNSDGDRSLFCGSSSVGATDLMNYAAFMRYAFRGSLKANYSIKNLGFRCARNADNI